MVCAVTAAQPLPKLTGPVNDFAHIISPDAAAALDQRIRALQAASGDVVVVVTVQTFAPYGSIEEYAVKLFEEAGIGQKDADNGVLIVLAVEERRVRIEVGYGLEEFIPDGFAGDTIRQTMLPAFRAGDYGAGLLAGTTRIIQRIAERRGVTLQGVPAQEAAPESRGGGVPAGLIILIVILALIVLRSSSRPSSRFHRRGPWGPTWSGWSGGVGGFGGGFGGGGGGFGGFGGGRSGGGGASGGW